MPTGHYRFRSAFGNVSRLFKGARIGDPFESPQFIDVSGAGDATVNGQYEKGIGTINDKEFWSGPGAQPTDLYVILWDGTQWIITPAYYVVNGANEVTNDGNFVIYIDEPYDILYFGWGTGNAPEDGQGSVGTGTPPAPTITGL